MQSRRMLARFSLYVHGVVKDLAVRPCVSDGGQCLQLEALMCLTSLRATHLIY